MFTHNHIRPLLVFILTICSLTLALSGQAATKIYKTVDEEGNVVFTDVPPKDGEDSAAVEVETPNTFAPAPATASGEREAWNVEPEATTDTDTFSYTSVAIVSPTDDQAVRENAGNVTFDVDVEPELQTGHKVRLLLDGTPEQEGPQLSFMLANVDRGTHSANVEIVDDAGKVLMVSNPITFHLMRVAAAPRPVQPSPKRSSN